MFIEALHDCVLFIVGLGSLFLMFSIGIVSIWAFGAALFYEMLSFWRRVTLIISSILCWYVISLLSIILNRLSQNNSFGF
jgi:hypothetical protein